MTVTVDLAPKIFAASSVVSFWTRARSKSAPATPRKRPSITSERCCVRDEGGPFEAAGMNVMVKRRGRSRQVWMRETSASEPLKNGALVLFREGYGGNLPTGHTVSGV